MTGIAPIVLAVSGLGTPVAYLIAGVVVGLFAIGFTAMAASSRRSGGFAVYIGQSFGGVAGFASAMVAIVAYNCLEIGFYGLLGLQAQAALQNLFGVSVPWPVIAVASVLVVYGMGALGIDVGARVLGVLIVLESGVLVLTALAITFQSGAQGLGHASFDPSNWANHSTLAVLALCLGAFVGFESTVLYRSEARDPRTTIPRATYIAVGLMTLCYVFVTWSVIQAFGESDAQQTAATQGPTMFFSAINHYVGGWAEHTSYALIVTSVLAAQLSFHNAINRYVHSMASAGVLPRMLSLTNGAGSPIVAGGAQTLLALAVVVGFAAAHLDPFVDLVIGLTTPGAVGVLFLEVLASLACVVFFARRPASRRRNLLMACAVIAASMLAVIIVYLAKYLVLITGQSGVINVLLLSVTPAVFVAGVIGALAVRRRHPEVLARLSSAESEAAVE